jgi:hypothetical protein
VDVDPPIGVLFGEDFGSPERLSAVGEDGGPAVLMLDGPLLACVLKSEDVVAVGVFNISSPASLDDMPLSLCSGHGHQILIFRDTILSGAREMLHLRLLPPPSACRLTPTTTTALQFRIGVADAKGGGDRGQSTLDVGDQASSSGGGLEVSPTEVTSAPIAAPIAAETSGVEG